MSNKQIMTPVRTALGAAETATDEVIVAGQYPYGVNGQVWADTQDNGATVNMDTPANDFAVLTSGVDAAGHARIVSRRAVRSSPGLPVKAVFSGVFDTPGLNNEQLLGIGSADGMCGFFFGYDAAGDFGIVIRNRGAQRTIKATDWNNRPTVTPTPSKLSDYTIKYQGHGAGAQYFGLEDTHSGALLYAHTEPQSGLETATAVGNPVFELQAICRNVGGTTSKTLRVDAMAGIVSGAVKSTGLDWAARRAQLRTNIGTDLVPLLSIRGRSQINGINSRLRSILNAATVANLGNRTAFAEFLINPTLDGAVWAPHNATQSGIEVDETATAYLDFGRAAHSIVLRQEADGGFDVSRIAEQLGPNDIWSIGIGFYSGNQGEASATINWREMHS
ncbi:hypothetical protein N9164_12545 [Draconibacterium sp.]|nr:hypothetical protein [Draconibacterium sp.]